MSGGGEDRRAVLLQALQKIEELEARLARTEATNREPVAVVGIGCRLPGGADSPEAFWNLLRDGVDAIRDVPDDRWDVERFFDPDPEIPGKMYSRRGGFLERVDGFDEHFFGLSPREAAAMDPQHRLALEVAWEALEHAGIVPRALSGTRTGVYFGITINDYGHLLRQRGAEAIDIYHLTGNHLSFVSGRLAYLLGLQGPALTVDTACSGALSSIHLAGRALRAGDCDIALAGGVNLMLAPESTVTICKGRMLSPDGRCKTFDAGADGFVRSEGCGVLVLRRVSDALECGDRILALLRGSDVNQDGESSGLTVPNKQAQEALIRHALADAGLQPGDVDFVEAHGTGTALGDPIEIRALADTYGTGHSKERPLTVGSVKTNIGHLESAAGVAGAIKAILALDRQEIPPNLHFKTPNPHIDWKPLPIEIPTECRPWPRGDRPRRAAVSSFGASGTNVHVVFEEAPTSPADAAPRERSALVCTASARDEGALRAQAAAYAARLSAADAPDAARFCSAANRTRQAFEERAAVVAADREGLIEGLRGVAAGESSSATPRATVDAKRRSKLAMLFSGQGSQRVGMGRALYAAEPVFRDALDRCDALFRPHLDRPLLEAMHAADPANSPLDRTLYTQTSLFAIEWALAALWRSWGVEPDAVLGHSVGEYPAAAVAGWMSLEDAAGLVAARARGMQALPEGGAMAVLFEAEPAVRDALAPWGDRLSIAACNGPTNTTVSGEADALDALLAARREAGIRSRKLAVSHAFHSAQMEPMLDAFEAAAGTIAFGAPRIPLIANVTGAPARAGELADPDYWRRHVRQPVRFADSMRALRDLGVEVFLEIGPAPTLCGMGAKCFDDGYGVWLPSLRDGVDDVRRMLHSAAELWVRGLDVDWGACDAFERPARVSLPTYPFQRRRHWIDLPPATGGQRLDPARHPLIAGRIPSPLGEALFSARLDPRVQPWLTDHRVAGRPIAPATIFLELAFAAGRELFGAVPELRDVLLHRPLPLDEEPAREVQVVVEPARDGLRSFRIAAAGPDGSWQVHATGALAAPTGQPPEAAAPTGGAGDGDVDRGGAVAQTLEPEAFYRRHDAAGFGFGPRFRVVERVELRDGAIEARIAAAPAGTWCVPPVTLDGCLQPLALLDRATGAWGTDRSVAAEPSDVPAPRVPFAFDRVRVFGAADGPLSCTLRPRDGAEGEGEGDGDVRVDIAVVGEGGFRLAFDGVALRRVVPGVDAAADVERPAWMFLDVWQPAAVPAAERPDIDRDASPRRLLLHASEALRARLGPALDAAGARWIAVDAPDGDGARDAADWRAAFRRAAADSGDAPRSVDDAGWSLAWVADDGAGSDPAAFLAALQAAGEGPDGAGAHAVALATAGARAIEPGEAPDAARAALWGLAGTARIERPDRPARRIDFEPGLPGEQVAALARWLGRGTDDRVALRGERRLACRLRRPAAAPGFDGAEVGLEMTVRGTLDGLELQPRARREPGPGEVEVEVHASGLNFRDVLNALDMYPGDAGDLGCEIAGRVTRLGPGADGPAPGTRVVAFAPRGFATHVCPRAALAWPIPDGMLWEEAATLPIAYLTAQLCLHDLARLGPDDRVLIHAATGGVGMAAVQVALRAGATVYGTASESKRALLRSMGVTGAFDSRSLSFKDDLLRATDGRGVTVALNSLGGDFIGATFDCLTDGGRFVEIGKIGIWTPQQVEALGRGIEYHVAYLGDVCDAEPERIRNLYREIFAGLADGSLRPLPWRAFPLEQAQAAFRFMSHARHRGKVVVPHRPPCPDPFRPQPDRAYAVTGGLRGLGLSLAERLVERGARAIVLAGRSGPTGEAAARLDALRVAGAELHVVEGDVAEPSTAQRVAEALRATGKPVDAVFHAAGIVDDALLSEQSAARLAAATRPKLDGARALCEEIDPLDPARFVAFSSFTVRSGAAAQANYVAANESLDAFCAARAAEGRPSVAIAWGPFAEVGMAAGLDARDRRRWEETLGLRFMDPARAWDAMEATLPLAPPNVAIADLDPARLAAARSADAAGYLAGAEDRDGEMAPGPAAVAGVRDEIEGLPARRRRERLERLVRDRLVDVLGLDDPRISGSRGFRELGMDSLTSVELRNRLQQDLRTSLRSTLAFDFANIDALVEHLAAEVFGLRDAVASASESSAPAAADDLSDLSAEEAEALLLQELASGDGDDDGR